MSKSQLTLSSECQLSHNFMKTIPNCNKEIMSDLIGMSDYYDDDCNELYDDYLEQFTVIRFHETNNVLIFGYKRHGIIGIVLNDGNVIGTFGIYNSNIPLITNFIDWCMINKSDDMKDMEDMEDMN